MFPCIRQGTEKPMLTEDCALAFGASRIRKQLKGTLTVPLLCVEKRFYRWNFETCVSHFASLVKRMRWCGRCVPLVRSIMRRRKAPLGTTTEHVKFKRSNKDWSTWRDSLRRKLNLQSKSSHFWSLSSGNQASCLTELRVMPTDWRVVNGPMVYSSAIGTPRKSHMWKKLLRWLPRVITNIVLIERELENET